MLYRTDWRLEFINLNSEVAFNALSNEDKEKLWIPNLVFENNPKGLFVKNELLSVLRIQREGILEDKFDFQHNEYKWYKGAENPVSFENIYEMKLACEMELHFYPFDTQRCYIQVSKIMVQVKKCHLIATLTFIFSRFNILI